jgi:hypothetical protein
MSETYSVLKPAFADKLIELVRWWERLPDSQSTDTVTPPTPIFFRNDSGFTIPPYAILQPTGTFESGVFTYVTVGRPVSASGAFVPLFNGPFAVANGEYGTAQDGPVFTATTDGSSFSAGNSIGWTNGSFNVSSGIGLIYLGPTDVVTNGCYLSMSFGGGGMASRRNWLGTLTLGYDGVVGGFWVTPTKALDGVLPTGSQWVVNLYKWDYGALGAVVRVEQDGGRWIPLQQEYSCPPDSPPSEPLGACNYYDPESGSVCAIMTEAACDLQSGGTWTEGGTC